MSKEKIVHETAEFQLYKLGLNRETLLSIIGPISKNASTDTESINVIIQRIKNARYKVPSSIEESLAYHLAAFIRDEAAKK
jgi:hypothetical protein